MKTYFKKCDACAMVYHYQEHEDFINNFDDYLLLSTELCLFIKQQIRQHIPVGSFITSLENRLDKTLNHQKILNAILHFDALLQHNYDFFCVICGYHPAILIMDLNRKVSFKCPSSQLDLPDEYDEDKADYVDADRFWNNVEMAMLLRGFPDPIVEGFRVDPDLLEWAPFIGRHTRRGKLLLNTEHRKVKKDTGDLETDCKEMTEESLYEMLHHSTLHELVDHAKRIGIKPKGTKLEIIVQIKNSIGKDKEKFRKVFSKVWGRSGGWVSATCEHGVVYALKFVLRSESPRDFVDILLSMKHQPNIVIVDMAHMVVAHGNKRKNGMFSPFNGMVAAPTESNVEKAAANDLKVSFSWLRKYEANDDPMTCDGNHPATGSSQHFCLFDRFHEGNCKSKAEVLRRITLVRELEGEVKGDLKRNFFFGFIVQKRVTRQF